MIYRAIFASLLLCIASISAEFREPNTMGTLFRSHADQPLVTMVPLIDNTEGLFAWNLSQELTKGIRRFLEQRENVLLYPEDKVETLTKKLKHSQDPFTPDITWIKTAFPHHHFIVFLELIEHEEVPLTSTKHRRSPENAPANFNTSLRIRIIDLRDVEPRIVLQEIVHDSSFIPQPFNQYRFHQVSWDHPAFSVSPMGLAHASLIKKVASRIEDYILLTY